MLKRTLLIAGVVAAVIALSAADQTAPSAPASATKKGARGARGPGGGPNQPAQPPPVAAPALYYNGVDIAAAIAAKEKKRAVDGQEFPSERLVTGAPKEGVGAYHLSIVTRHVPINPIAHSGGGEKGFEIHYIMDGGGTSVTGGTYELLDPAPTPPAGTPPGRGGFGNRKHVGGVSRHVTKGDFVIIPAGAPHGYSQIDGHITYAEFRWDVHPSLATLVETEPLDGKNHSTE